MAIQAHKGLVLVNWNANGVSNKKTELTQFLHAYNVDIAGITETHLNKKNKLYIPNYSIYRSDRSESKGGGVLVAIKTSIIHHQIDVLNSPRTESIAIRAIINNSIWNIITVYNPPTSKIKDINFRHLFQSSNNTLLIGDFNAKNTNWGCRHNNQNGLILSQIANILKLKLITPAEPTYYPFDRNKNPDILDIGITNSNITFFSTPIFELDSDHIPVLITTQQLAPQHAPAPKSKIGRINWNQFQKIVSVKIPAFKILNSPIEIEHALSHFNTIIHTTVEESHINTEETKKTKNQELPPEILKAIKVKNKTRRLWTHLKTPELKRIKYHNKRSKKINQYPQQSTISQVSRTTHH